ncbi:hypothetical protein pdam_00000823 [Pocillopora damicornis]|uniref:DUF3668 domain-containing protein n=1 Tax=Pocillopora damicornis TaxID=46731 RepID=A0A3M6TVD7_POCDA|nr:hypothetical protein pdam_00000823 [Pocillopora damicornis]
MGLSDGILVVVSVLEGRRFPKRPRHKIIVETKFDGETLTTDPIDHVETPEFTTELAWELNKKSLHQHRLQRTPIKIQRAQWYSLLSTKYQRMKPELKLMLSLEDDTQSKQTEQQSQQEDERQHPRPSPPRKPESDGIQCLLNEDQGYYEIGPQHEDDKIFILSVTIGLASNLAKLVPSSFALPDPNLGGGFYFYYSLLSNDVTNEVFHDLLQPNFPAERASVRIRSNLELLRTFFTQHSGLEVYLCCGDQSLGKAVVSFQGLLNEQQNLASPTVIEGLFPLIAPGRSRQSSGAVDDSEPAVGVSVSLRQEQQETMGNRVPEVDSLPYGSKSPAKQLSSSPFRGKQKEPGKGSETEITGEHLKGTPPRPQSSTPHSGPEKLGLEGGVTLGAQKNSPSKKSKTAQASQPQISAPGPSSTVPLLGTRLPIDPGAHHFCFSIDLRSISNLDVTSPVNCFLRYTYPFFGSAAPVITSPPVQVQRNMEVLLPKSFCAFDFASSPILLQQTLTRPARRIGELHVVLGLEDMGPVNIQRLMEANECHRKCIKNSMEKILSSSLESSQTSSAIPLSEPQRVPPAQPKPPPVTDPRDTEEYKTALELELWKEQQEEMFQAQMQHRENSHMKALAEEWKRRDKERELMVKKKLEEYSRLEEKIKQSIADLERREKLLSTNEAQVMHLKEELEREHERRTTEMREAARRLKDDCSHQVEMERMKVKDLEEQKQRLVEQVYEAEKRYQAKENEFMAYKEQQLTKPEVKLESEINLLKMEKTELERKLETANKSKIHYKQQWGRALRELARLKQQEQTAARARLKKQEQELEHMRLRYLAAEEKEVVKSEKEELEEIKLELARLKQQEEAKARVNQAPTEEQEKTSAANSSQRRSVKHSPGLTSVHEHDEEDIDSRIAKLIEERDTLLHTGVYTTDDRIIVELDRQIRDAIASRGT